MDFFKTNQTINLQVTYNNDSYSNSLGKASLFNLI